MALDAKVEHHSHYLTVHLAARLVKGNDFVIDCSVDRLDQLTEVGKSAFTAANAVNSVERIDFFRFRIHVYVSSAFDREQAEAEFLDGLRAAIKAATGEDLEVEHVEVGARGGSPNNFLDQYLAADAAASLEVPPSWNVAAVARVLGTVRAWLADAGVDLDDPKVARAVLGTLLFVDQVAREGGRSEDQRATVAYDLLQKLLPLLAGEVRQQHGESR
jgi:hypothetical protein